MLIKCFMEYIASLVSSLAWPVVVLVIFFILRGTIQNLLPNLRRIRWKDIEAEFDHAREISREAHLPLSDAQDESSYHRLSRYSPVAAILESWRELELTIRNIHPSNSPYSPVATMRKLVKDGKIDQSTLALFDDLRVLRNTVAHSRNIDLSPGKAYEYAQMTLRLASKIQSLPR